MNNWKIVVGVLLGSMALVLLAIWGLGRTERRSDKAVPETDLIEGARWITGNDNFKVTVVEFSDLQCPACKTAEPIARELRNMDGVRFVYRHFPLTMSHQNAWRAARAAEAANGLGKGYAMMDELYTNQEEWSGLRGGELDNKFKEYASKIGLDGSVFWTNYQSDDSEKGVKADSDLAIKLRLNGTPTFFVNGKLSSGNLIIAQVKQLISNK